MSQYQILNEEGLPFIDINEALDDDNKIIHATLNGENFRGDEKEVDSELPLSHARPYDLRDLKPLSDKLKELQLKDEKKESQGFLKGVKIDRKAFEKAISTCTTNESIDIQPKLSENSNPNPAFQSIGNSETEPDESLNHITNVKSPQTTSKAPGLSTNLKSKKRADKSNKRVSFNETTEAIDCNTIRSTDVLKNEPTNSEQDAYERFMKFHNLSAIVEEMNCDDDDDTYIEGDHYYYGDEEEGSESEEYTYDDLEVDPGYRHLLNVGNPDSLPKIDLDECARSSPFTQAQVLDLYGLDNAAQSSTSSPSLSEEDVKSLTDGRKVESKNLRPIRPVVSNTIVEHMSDSDTGGEDENASELINSHRNDMFSHLDCDVDEEEERMYNIQIQQQTRQLRNRFIQQKGLQEAANEQIQIPIEQPLEDAFNEAQKPGKSLFKSIITASSSK